MNESTPKKRTLALKTHNTVIANGISGECPLVDIGGDVFDQSAVRTHDLVRI